MERGNNMQAKEFNDLWVILNNLPDVAKNAIPEKYMAFVKSSMLPDAEPRKTAVISEPCMTWTL